jgi:hypothetical protein
MASLGFSTIAAPLNNLTKKDVPFKWGDEENQSFKELKTRLCEAPLLQLPDFGKAFEIECDAKVSGLESIKMLYSSDHDFKHAFSMGIDGKGWDKFYMNYGFLF